MNIFVIDPDTTKCAQALDDLRLNKMIVETAQLLSAAMHARGYKGTDIYKSTHVNHPCAIWARETSANYNWLLLYMNALVKERQIRTGKGHKSYDIFNTLCGGTKLMPIGKLTQWPNCTPHKDMPLLEAYQLTLSEKWLVDKRPAKWTKRTMPVWAKS